MELVYLFLYIKPMLRSKYVIIFYKNDEFVMVTVSYYVINFTKGRCMKKILLTVPFVTLPSACGAPSVEECSMPIMCRVVVYRSKE